MIIGIVVGKLMGQSASVFAPLGALFIQLIKMLVVPLVFVSIVSGAASLGATQSAGRIGVTTIIYVFGTTFLAVLVAFAAGEFFRPRDSLETIRAFFPEQNYSQPVEK